MATNNPSVMNPPPPANATPQQVARFRLGDAAAPTVPQGSTQNTATAIDHLFTTVLNIPTASAMHQHMVTDNGYDLSDILGLDDAYFSQGITSSTAGAAPIGHVNRVRQ